MPAFTSLGFSFITASEPTSMPRAREGAVSVSRFTQRICMVERGEDSPAKMEDAIKQVDIMPGMNYYVLYGADPGSFDVGNKQAKELARIVREKMGSRQPAVATAEDEAEESVAEVTAPEAVEAEEAAPEAVSAEGVATEEQGEEVKA